MSNDPILSPQVVGRAENAHRAVLGRVLAGSGITYEQWVVLTITAASGDVPVRRAALVGRITGALRIDSAAALATIDELAASGLLESSFDDEPQVGLTREGRTIYRNRRAAVDDLIAPVYGEIIAEELATAGRVLTMITARLDAALADG